MAGPRAVEDILPNIYCMHILAQNSLLLWSLSHLALLSPYFLLMTVITWTLLHVHRGLRHVLFLNQIYSITRGDFRDYEEDSTNTIASQRLESLSFKYGPLLPYHQITTVALYQTIALRTSLCLKSLHIKPHHLQSPCSQTALLLLMCPKT